MADSCEEVEPVEIPTAAEAIAYDEHLASIRGCKACHGEDLSGEIEFQDPMVGVIANANLTGGQGSEVVDYTTAECGEYLAGLCSLCHGPGFSGGPIPGTLPEDPPALNLTPAGELQGWTFEDFLAAMRTGMTPGGRQLRDEYMPYKTLFGEMTDGEWEAIWLFLQTLPPREYGNR